MPSAPQLPLPFPHEPGYEPADFLQAASNEAALSWLGRTEDWPNGQLALWGESGRGKTHLLRIWAARTGAVLHTGSGLTAFLDLPRSGGVALDDAAQAPEEPLFHLLNAAREARLPLLLAAVLPPARWPVRLPDLASRLRAVTAVEIGPPEESLLDALLLRLAADRQLELSPSLMEWLRRRLPRSPGALRDAVARLDHAAMAAGGRVSRAMAAEVLADLLAETEN